MPRLNNEWICDTSGTPGCERNAVVTTVCLVEGREFALCSSCNRAWRAYAMQSHDLAIRCPGCAPGYVERSGASFPANSLRMTTEDVVLSGPLAEVIDAALRSEGVLVDVRRRVLIRLWRLSQSDDEGYVGMLLRTTSGVTA